MNVLTVGKRQTAIRVHQQGHLIVSWGHLDNPEHLRNIANEYSWPMPASGLTGWLIDMARHQTWRWPSARLKEAFLAKMFENDENFDFAVMNSGIDIYAPDSERV